MTELKKEHYEFNTEISKLMKMIIHNFYSSKDIFLRELISNASDAIDKAKYNLINNSNELNADILDLQIKIYSDKETNCLTIEDRGIGMNKEDVINCLGTIAKSGTEEFVKNILKNNNEKNIDLIGQFGVGFYSAFLVADKVQVLTKHIDSADDTVIVWESNSTDGYNISEINDSDFKYGTKINLFLNNEELEFLEENKITEIVKKHSGYISHPILLLKKIKIEKQNDTVNTVDKPHNDNEENSDDDMNMDELAKQQKLNDSDTSDDDDKENDDDKDENDDKKENDDKENDDDKEKNDDDKEENDDDKEENDDDKEKNDDKEENDDNKEESNDDKEESNDDKEESNDNKEESNDKNVVEEYKYEFVKINSTPIWSKDPNDVSEEEYQNLYKSISNDYGSYQTYKHFKTEGDIEFSAILFIPKTAPNNLFENKKSNKNIKLYVKKVLITDECKDLFPEHFNFVCGIVDSTDLPLNASRELLQQSKVIKKINKILVRKTLEMITDLKSNKDDFNNFYDNFSKNIKLGIHEDATNKSKLVDLLMFPTNKSNDKLISLDDYISNMKENQQGIYYIIGNTMENIKNSAFIEKLNKKDYEVLLMCDPLDEYIMQQIYDYNDKKLINVIKDDLKLEDSKDEDPTKYDDICKKIKELLDNTITKVTVSTKLDSHPMIVTSPMGWSANMERIIKSQALSTNNLPPYMLGQRVLEINPDHDLIKKLIDSNYDKNQLDILYNMALLAGGYELNNVNNFLSKLYNNL